MRGRAVRRAGVAVAVVLAGAAAVAGPAGAAGSPTCSDLAFLDVATHGQHVVRDYVGGGGVWPPAGGSVGAAVKANGGPELPGGPAAHGHFDAPTPVAPGASFCTGSSSPGLHL